MKIIQTQCIPYTAQFNSVKLLCHTMRIPVLYVPAVWKFFLLSGRYNIKHFAYLKVTKATLWSLEQWFSALWEAWRGLNALATNEGEKRQLSRVHWAFRLYTARRQVQNRQIVMETEIRQQWLVYHKILERRTPKMMITTVVSHNKHFIQTCRSRFISLSTASVVAGPTSFNLRNDIPVSTSSSWKTRTPI